MAVQRPAVTTSKVKRRRAIFPKTVFRLSKDDAFSVTMPKDGACLFHAISWFFKDVVGYSAMELRDRVCDYILCNAFEPLDSDISILEVIKADLDPSEAEILGDETIISEYVSELRREDTWCDDIELQVLSRMLNITIVVFQSRGHSFYPVSVVGGKVEKIKISIVPVYRVNGNHYEALNMVHQVHRDKLKIWLAMTDEEGDVSLPHFQYHKVFATHQEVVMSVANPPNILNNNLDSNMCVDELEDDYKVENYLRY
jgi:hypothetical protein